MSNDKLKPCPFCGEPPKLTERPDNSEGTQFFCAIGCFCGSYSATAHRWAVRPTAAEAKAVAASEWNTRHEAEKQARPLSPYLDADYPTTLPVGDEAEKQAGPVAWQNSAPVDGALKPIGHLLCGDIYGNELQDWEFEADQSVCDQLNELYFCKGHQAKVPVYVHPAQATAVAPGFVLVRSPITEEMHQAACKALTRASGLDGTPQRMLDALAAASLPLVQNTAPPSPLTEQAGPVARAHVRSVTPGRIDELDVLRPLPQGTHLLYAAPVQASAVAHGTPPSPLTEQDKVDAELALDLLAALFDAYENGPDCYEDPDETSGYLGKAVSMSDEDFHRCAELLNRRRPIAAARAAGKEQQ